MSENFMAGSLWENRFLSDRWLMEVSALLCVFLLLVFFFFFLSFSSCVLTIIPVLIFYF